MAEVVARAKALGILATALPVSHAFHSPSVAPAAQALKRKLLGEDLGPLRRTVFSTITGAALDRGADLVDLLCRQVTSPVRFIEAVSKAAEGVDLFIEVGPGEVLSGLIGDWVPTPVVPMDAGGASLAGLLNAAAAAYVFGADVCCSVLFEDRFTRPFDPDRRPSFFVNPCELAPADDGDEITMDAAASQAEADEEEVVMADRAATASVETPLELIRQLVAARAELPSSAIMDDSRLLSDLHLNSISVGQIVLDASKRLDLPTPVAPTAYANATVAEVARALEEWSLQIGATTREQQQRLPPGVDAWIRPFEVHLVERPLKQRRRSDRATGWRIIAADGHPLRDSLERAFARSASGGGVVLCLPEGWDDRQIPLLLEGARAVMREGSATQFILVQQGRAAAAFAKTLHLERPTIDVCIVDVPCDHPRAVECVLTEAMNVIGYCEAVYDVDGCRRVPVLTLLPCDRSTLTPWPFGSDDVLLITGGGKGIAAECALAVAKETGVRLALLGRSRPDDDEELRQNLERFSAAGIEYRYIAADVTDPERVRRAVQEATDLLGPVTAFWHAAGLNEPKLIDRLDEPAFRRTIAPKLSGAENVLAAIEPECLKQFMAFGSIIGRAGLAGEADYAVANDCLARRVERWRAEHPDCRCLVIEWSVWQSVGMGKRLGRVEALMQQGVTPIPTEQGLQWLTRLIRHPAPPVRVTVAGRFGAPPTLELQRADLPLRRFLEHPRVDYPGIELVVEAELSEEADPYVADHVLHGEPLFPAVMALEAMVQAAMALSDEATPPLLENVEFVRPIIVPKGETVTIRMAALQREDGQIEVVVRSGASDFQIDHFRATCRKRSAEAETTAAVHTFSVEDDMPAAVNPQRDLYGRLLFHDGRFRRLRGYRRLMARECLAEIEPDARSSWFGPYRPATLVLGDPGGRDAAIHAIQACIPHVRILPIGVQRITPAVLVPAQPMFVHAVETSHNGDLFTYDVQILDRAGSVIECWEGLRLKVVEDIPPSDGWSPALLGPYAERRVNETFDRAAVSVVLQRNGVEDRRSRSDRAIRLASGQCGTVSRRPDGKPEADNGRSVSASHAGELTLAVAGDGPVGCDLEPVATRTRSAWRRLLGSERFSLVESITREGAEALNPAATRVWAASECLKKAGATVDAPLVFLDSTDDGWVMMRSGALVAATYIAPVRGEEDDLALAIVVSGDAPSL